jgi:hypothetical protein
MIFKDRLLIRNSPAYQACHKKPPFKVVKRRFSAFLLF